MDLENHKFPILSSDIQFQKKVVNVSGDDIDNILKNFKDKQVSYIGITESTMGNNQILKEIFSEENTLFSKIFDSKDHFTEFNVKIFKINFEK